MVEKPRRIDLEERHQLKRRGRQTKEREAFNFNESELHASARPFTNPLGPAARPKIGRASCRERV